MLPITLEMEGWYKRGNHCMKTDKVFQPRVKLWDEELTFSNAFAKLQDKEALSYVLKELNKRLLFQKSFAEYNVEIDHNNAEIQQKLIDNFCQAFKINGVAQLEEILKKNGQTKEELLEKLFYQEKINHLKQIIITPQVLNDAFLQHKASLDNITFSLIRVSSEKIAQEIYYRLHDDGADFTELAKKFSIGEESADGGLIGPKPLSSLNPELRSKLQTLQPGELSEPFMLGEETYFILKLIKLESAQLTTQVENSLREKLFEQWIERQLKLANAQILTSGENS
jgi:parvulin-like peptidyl-prolyl isomerase